MRFYTYPIRAITFYDIPLKGRVSFEEYAYSTFSPIGRIKVNISYLHCENGKVKSFSLGNKLDSPKRANQKSHGGDRKSEPKLSELNQHIISDVGLIDFLNWKSDQCTIMGGWLFPFHDFGSYRFRK